jgi:LuxR family transcriptional regulator, maltose regulon positive regulatory protein
MNEPGSGAALERGRRALERGAWPEAVEALTHAATADAGNPVAWECLANAHMWVQQTEQEIDARQMAYALYREAGDDASSARVCLDLVWDYAELRGEPAVANGWFQRARRLLETLPPAPEHALFGVFQAWMTVDEDPAAAAALARDAAALAEQVGARDVGTLALALQGLALVTEGRVADGMSLLDEAIAGVIGREITDPQWFYFACCSMIDACDRVRDFGRSLEWCDRLRSFAQRWQVQAFLTTCRIKYTAALLWRGEWQRCDDELQRAVQELGAERPGLAAGALVRLAALRRLQARTEEAEALLERAGAHPLGATVRIALALDAGDGHAALDLCRALLRRTPASACTERVLALEQQVRAAAMLGLPDEVRAAAAGLDALAAVIDTPAVRAAALTAAGVLASVESRHEQALRCFEDAVHLLEASGSRHEAARVRIDHAHALAALDRTSQAAAEAGGAVSVLEAVGAKTEAGRGRQLLERLGRQAAGGTTRRRGRAPGALTRRQREVLGLVADGLGDRDIAERLCLSEHTVHRHLANIFTRLGVSTRTAAAARALRGDLL